MIKNNASSETNYIIFADSMRLENHTPHGSYISNFAGMVSLDSQQKIDEYYSNEHAESKLITSSHGVFYVPIYADEVLDIVYSNMTKDKELQRSLTRK